MTLLMRTGVVAAAAMSTWLVGSAAQVHRASCILLPAESRNVTTGSRGKGSTNYTCVYDASAVTLTCTNKGSLMGLMKVTSVTTFMSVDDLVDTISAIPPLVKSASLRLTAPGSITSTTYTYDRQKRLTREVATAALAVTVTTDYSDWDAAGRPRKAHITTTPGNRPPSDQVMTYDDAARTKTIKTTLNGAVDTDVVTFDTNGNQIKATGTSAGASYTSTTTISATTKVCR